MKAKELILNLTNLQDGEADIKVEVLAEQNGLYPQFALIHTDTGLTIAPVGNPENASDFTDGLGLEPIL
jgi:hypothetical protein